MVENPEYKSRLTREFVERFREKFAERIENDWKLLKNDPDLGVKIIGGGKIKKSGTLDGAFTRLAQDFLGANWEDIDALRKEIFE